MSQRSIHLTEPLALDAGGVLIEFHLIRSGASRAAHQIAVYLPVALDETPFDDMGRLDRDQALIALCTDVYLDLSRALDARRFAHYDATAPAVVSALFVAHYVRVQSHTLALTLTPDLAEERNIPAARRYILQMAEGDVPVHWSLLDGFGRPLTILGATDQRVSRRTPRGAPRKRRVSQGGAVNAAGDGLDEETRERLRAIQADLRKQQHPNDGADA